MPPIEATGRRTKPGMAYAAPGLTALAAALRPEERTVHRRPDGHVPASNHPHASQ